MAAITTAILIGAEATIPATTLVIARRIIRRRVHRTTGDHRILEIPVGHRGSTRRPIPDVLPLLEGRLTQESRHLYRRQLQDGPIRVNPAANQIQGNRVNRIRVLQLPGHRRSLLRVQLPAARLRYLRRHRQLGQRPFPLRARPVRICAAIRKLLLRSPRLRQNRMPSPVPPVAVHKAPAATAV